MYRTIIPGQPVTSTKAFTGVVPFNHLQSITSMVGIIQGERPPRPTSAALTDDTWGLMQRCWNQEPQLRPGIREVLQDLVSGLFRSLHRVSKSSAEFQVALSQFNDSTERGGCVGRLDGAELEEFVNFLDDVRLLFNRFHLTLVVTFCIGAKHQWVR